MRTRSGFKTLDTGYRRSQNRGYETASRLLTLSIAVLAMVSCEHGPFTMGDPSSVKLHPSMELVTTTKGVVTGDISPEDYVYQGQEPDPSLLRVFWPLSGEWGAWDVEGDVEVYYGHDGGLLKKKIRYVIQVPYEKQVEVKLEYSGLHFGPPIADGIFSFVPEPLSHTVKVSKTEPIVGRNFDLKFQEVTPP